MAKEKQYWLLKTEAEAFSIDDLKRVGREPWSGVRNYQARNWIRSMQVGDLCLFYHTGDEKSVVGVCKVASKPYPDKEEPWTLVDVNFVKKFKNAIPLPQIKNDPSLRGMVLLKAPRLSVQPVSEKQFTHITMLAK